MTYEPTIWFYILTFLNVYLVLGLLFIIGLTIFRIDRIRLLDYVICLFLGIVVSESIKYVINSPRPIPMYGMNFEGGSFPSTHTTMAFTGFFFYLFCTKFNKNKAMELKKRIARVLPYFKSYVDIKSGEVLGQNQKRLGNTIAIIGFLLIADVIAALRIITGAHYFADIIAGIILGFCVVLPFMYYDISGRRI